MKHDNQYLLGQRFAGRHGKWLPAALDVPVGVCPLQRFGITVAPIGAGRPRGFDPIQGNQMVQRLTGPVVHGEVQLPDIQRLAFVLLDALVLLGSMARLQDVAGAGAVLQDPGGPVQFDTVGFQETPRLARRGHYEKRQHQRYVPATVRLTHRHPPEAHRPCVIQGPLPIG